jgi:YD repeat-containing protein
MVKRFLVVLISLFGLFTCVAQIPKEPGNVPSPQAWNFVQYGKTPISYFTGLPNINVNLDQVGQSGFTLPISLNYNVASVKPDIHPGPTGSGWNLSLGGVVTRKVRGLTDEFYFEQDVNPGLPQHLTYTYFNGYRNISNPTLYDVDPASILGLTRPILCTGPNGVDCLQPASYYSSHKLQQIPQTLPFLWDNVTYFEPSNIQGLFWPAGLNSSCGSSMSTWIEKGLIDRQPDEFSFNVMGLSGKFFLPRGNDTEVRNIECNKKVRIYVSSISENIDIPSQLSVPTYRGPSSNAADFFYGMSPWQYNHRYPKTVWSFVIIDEEGNRYYFGKSAADINYGNTILNPDTEAIEYGIDVYNISQDYWKADSWHLTRISLANGKNIDFEYQRGPFQTSMYLSSFDANISSTDLAGFRWDDRGGRLICPSYLSRIYSEDFQVNLNYSESSQLKYEDAITDIYAFKPGVPPDYIYNKIYDEYVFANSALKWLKLDQIIVKRNDAPPIHHNLVYNNVSNQRLMLQSITTNDGTANIANHQFTYNTSLSLPNYLSGQTDHWGYWNGRAATNNPALFYQTKEPDASYLYAGVLTKIKYPTGGFTELTYEPNEYKSIVESDRTLQPTVVSNTLGGGLRIQKIEDYDAVTTIPYNQRQYFYKTGYSSSLSPSQTQQLSSSGVLNMRPKYYWTGNVPYYNLCIFATGSTVFAVASSQPLHYLTDDYQIGYSEVAEKNLDGSYSIYKFSNHDNGYKDEPYINAHNDVFSSPFTRYTGKSFERGNLIEKIDFNSTGQPVYKKTTSYKPSDATKPAFLDSEASYFNNESFGPSGGSGGSYVFVTKFVLFGTQYKKYKYQFLPDVEEEYVYHNGSNPVKTTTQYFYENPLVARPTRIVSLNSKGEDITTIQKYAHDYPGNFMMSNIANTKPGIVLEKLVLKKDPATNIQKIVSAELNEFALSTGSNMPWLNSVYKMDINQPVDYSSYTPTIPSTRDFNSSFLYPKDSRYSEVGKVLKYDQQYNPLEVISQKGERTIVLMGGKNNLVIASVTPPIGETAYNLWGYTSFEQYKYRDADGVLQTEFDSEKDFAYSGIVNADAFSGKHSFNGIVTSKEFVHSADVYVLAKQGGNTPVFQYIAGTITYNGPAFVKIGEKSGWDIYKTSHAAGGTKIQINSNGNLIDEVRVLALNSTAFMKTYCYFNGQLSSMTDPKFNRTSYEYDKLSRLVLIRDQDNNILKKICYNYAGQPENCLSACTNVTPNWQNTSTPPTCQQGICGNTGYQLQEQRDMNPCSPTYNQPQTVLVYNPTACTPGSGVNISYDNPNNYIGFTAVYVNNATGQPYSFSIPAGTGTLGCIPAASYNVTISKPGNSMIIYFGTGCQGSTGTSAYFGKVLVSASACNSIGLGVAD